MRMSHFYWCLLVVVLNSINAIPSALILQVRVQLGEQVKGTACAEGRPDPGEEEQLGFAVDGKV